MPVDWSLAENALRAWVVTASGLPQSLVIWANQNGPKPLGQHITLHLGEDVPLGAFSENTHDYEASRPAGEEIHLVVKGTSEFSLEVQVYGSKEVGATSARALVKRIQTALGLPSIRDALADAGLVCFDRGTITNVPAILDADFEARSVLEARFYVTDDAFDATTFIETVEITDQGNDETFIVSIG